MMEELTLAVATVGELEEILTLYRSLINTPGGTWDEGYPGEDEVRPDIENGALYTLRDKSGRLICAASAGNSDELDVLKWNLNKPCELCRLGVAAD